MPMKTPMSKRDLVGLFGSQSAVANACGVTGSAVSYWRGPTPAERCGPLVLAAREKGISLSLHELRPDLWGPDDEPWTGGPIAEPTRMEEAA